MLNHPSAPATTEPDAIDEFDAPGRLTTAEAEVWRELAPLAFANRTLTRASSAAFCDFVGNVTREREMRRKVMDCDELPHHRLMKFVWAGYREFNLSPCGKPMEGAAKPRQVVNPLDRFTGNARKA